MLDFDTALLDTLKRHSSHPGILVGLDYAVRPPGKLFRPRLLESIAEDLEVLPLHDVLTLGCALELHHAYSLVHDDMPCMDNDDVRRGKPTTHKAFGEWKALLLGDSLLAISYAELEKLNAEKASFIRRFFHWSTGARGLILGQWIDLGLEAEKDIASLMRMHELKTARLMQVAAVGALALAKPHFNIADLKRFMRLGLSIGLAFQLLDDLDDLSSATLSEHELQVNPFLLAPQASREKLAHHLAVLEKEELPVTRKFLAQFLKTSAANLLKNANLWGQHVPTQKSELTKLFTSGICA